MPGWLSRRLDQGDFRANVERAMARYGAGRVGLVLGTSTSGISDSENAYAHLRSNGAMPDDFHFLKIQTAQATAEFLRLRIGIARPLLWHFHGLFLQRQSLGGGAKIDRGRFLRRGSGRRGG